MISVEIRVNGNLIATIHAHNLDGLEESTYNWTAAEFPFRLDAPPVATAGQLKHKRAAGAIELARALCAAIRARSTAHADSATEGAPK